MTTVAKSILVIALGAFVLACAVSCSADLKKKEEEKGSIEKGKDKVKGWVKDGEDATKTKEALNTANDYVKDKVKQIAK